MQQCLAWLHSCRGVELWSCGAASQVTASVQGQLARCYHMRHRRHLQPQHNTAKPALAPVLAARTSPALLHCTPPAATCWPGSWLLVSFTCRCPLAPWPLLTPDSSDTARVPRHRRARPASPRGGRRRVWRHGTSCISAAAACTRLSVSAVLGPVRHVCPTTPQQ